MTKLRGVLTPIALESIYEIITEQSGFSERAWEVTDKDTVKSVRRFLQEAGVRT